ncbi:hypothetical protein DFJ73DRAFT_777449 [Zopfochytrium polystomum]|nr:hypothetical protein DFJ73DRAFT_777449 [Zopfochytrium polystomum]
MVCAFAIPLLVVAGLIAVGAVIYGLKGKSWKAFISFGAGFLAVVTALLGLASQLGFVITCAAAADQSSTSADNAKSSTTLGTSNAQSFVTTITSRGDTTTTTAQSAPSATSPAVSTCESSADFQTWASGCSDSCNKLLSRMVTPVNATSSGVLCPDFIGLTGIDSQAFSSYQVIVIQAQQCAKSNPCQSSASKGGPNCAFYSSCSRYDSQLSSCYIVEKLDTTGGTVFIPSVFYSSCV